MSPSQTQARRLKCPTCLAMPHNPCETVGHAHYPKHKFHKGRLDRAIAKIEKEKPAITPDYTYPCIYCRKTIKGTPRYKVTFSSGIGGNRHFYNHGPICESENCYSWCSYRYE